MAYRKSFNKGIGSMRKSDCILNDGHTTNSFNLENRGNAKSKKNNKKKGSSQSPLKSSLKKSEGKEIDIFRRSSSQHQIPTNDGGSRQ